MKKNLPALLLACSILFAVLFSIIQFLPPAALPTTASPEDFSGMRALQHIQAITAQGPHPTGSIANLKVQQYILDRITGFGYQAAIQKTTGFYSLLKTIGSVENILVRVPGTSTNNGALLLMAHYDSNENTPGAADNASGVAVLLETLRALHSGPKPVNNLIFLFTDGEDSGTLGANAFVAEHPWMKDVRVAINIDGIQQYRMPLLETSANNGWLIEEFARSSKDPFAFSWTYDAYRYLLPTMGFDLAPFKQAGVQGLNFVSLYNFPEYHLLDETPDRVDPASLQSAGNPVLALARNFKKLASDVDISSVDMVFFNFGTELFLYDRGAALILAFLLIFLFSVVMITGLWHGYFSIRKLLYGVSAVLLITIFVAVLLSGLWLLVQHLDPQATVNRTSPHLGNDILYFPGFLALGLGLFLLLAQSAGRWVSLADMAVGSLVPWLGLAIYTTWKLPGFSYLAVWPLFFSLLTQIWLYFIKPPENSYTKAIGLSVAAIPILLILAPFIFGFFLGLGFTLWYGFFALIVLTLSPLLLQFEFIQQNMNKYILPGALLVIAAGCIVVKLAGAGYSPSQPRLNDLSYLLDGDKNQSYWVSLTAQTPDDWQQQFANPKDAQFYKAEVFPALNGANRILMSQAPLVSLAPPELIILEDKTEMGLRTLRLNLRSLRQARCLVILFSPKIPVESAEINGKNIYSAMFPPNSNPDSWRQIEYQAPPPEGIELLLKIRSNEQPQIYLMDESEGLPAIPGWTYPARPADTVSSGDYTWVKKLYRIGGN